MSESVDKGLGIELWEPETELVARTWQGFAKSKDVGGQARTAE